MEIKKGDKFLCIKDLVLFDGEFSYKRGEIYQSDFDECITDIQGDRSHYWVKVTEPHLYFKPLKDVDRMYTDATGRLRELHRNYTGNKIGNPDVADYFDNKDVNHKYFSFSAQWGLEEFYEEEGYDYVSEEVFIELNGLEEKSTTKEEQRDNAMEKSVISNKKDEIVQNVVQKYNQRSQIGIKKYNTTLQENPDGIEVFLTHLQEELMDATLYIEKLKQQVKQLKDVI